jgi:tetratricopeptide (TPR) repeat protein
MIAVCLIVKDAAGTLERCLASVQPYVDEVVVYDTGSTDGTVELLDKLARADGGARIVVERGEWRDDFSWARERSFALASADWLMWLDADDVLVGGKELQSLVLAAPRELDGFVVLYDCERDESGYVTQQVWRVRLVRKETGFQWHGLVHEGLFLPRSRGPRLEAVSAGRLRVVHQPEPRRLDAARNIRILLAAEARTSQLEQGTLFNLAFELVMDGRFEEAIPRLRRYVDCAEDWSDESAQAACLLAACLRMLGRPMDALDVGLMTVEHRADWTEAALGLAESYAVIGRWEDAQNWARRAVELGIPRSPALLDPRWLALAPLLRLAEASFNLGECDQAFESLAEIRRRFGADEWLTSRLEHVDADPAHGLKIVREALSRYDPCMRAAVRALWRDTSTQ